MLATACVALALSVIWTAIALFANAMSDVSSAPFSGAWTVWAVWVITAGLFLWWAIQATAPVHS